MKGSQKVSLMTLMTLPKMDSETGLMQKGFRTMITDVFFLLGMNIFMLV